jgi:hypothetical protein
LRTIYDGGHPMTASSTASPTITPRRRKPLVLLLLALFLLPVAARAALFAAEGGPTRWSDADWSSSGTLPAAATEPDARIIVFSGRTGGWKGVVAVHSWAVVKRANAKAWTRYDVVGWGTPVRVNGWAPDGRWFGHAPTVVADLRGDAAAALIPRIEAAVTSYQFRRAGDYKIWPGPNSNSFVAALLRAVPELGTALPPNAIGRDFRDGFYAGLTDSRTGVELNLAGYAGAKFGWVEGIEVNLFGLVVGLDLRRPAIKLPGFGRIGMDSLLPAARPPATAA